MSSLIFDRLIQKETKIAVIGLGYVGLPIALEFARKIKVVGFDINQERVDLMKNNIDPSNELESTAFEGCDITFTFDLNDLRDVTFFVVAVPTPQHRPVCTSPMGCTEAAWFRVVQLGHI